MLDPGYEAMRPAKHWELFSESELARCCAVYKRAAATFRLHCQRSLVCGSRGLRGRLCYTAVRGWMAGTAAVM